MIKEHILSKGSLLWGEFYPDQALVGAFGRSNHLEVGRELGLSFLALPLYNPYLGKGGLTMDPVYLKGAEELDKLSFTPGQNTDLAYLAKAASSFPVLLLLDGPFQYLSSVMPFEDFSRLLVREKDLVRRAVARYMQALLSFLDSVSFPLAGLVLADDLAGSGGPLYGPQTLDDLYFPLLASFCQAQDLPVLVHADGDVYPLLDSYQQAGVSGIQSLEWAGPTTISMLVSSYPELIFWGGLKRQQLVSEKQAALSSLEAMARIRAEGGLVLLGSSTGILDGDMDPAILRALGRALYED